jgi:starvation-inducible DNA-binding protein
MAKSNDIQKPHNQSLNTPTDLQSDTVSNISSSLNALLADMFALYLKTKNFHWHMVGPHFRDYHMLLDEQAAQIFKTTDLLAERVRKIGGTTLRSIGHISKLQRLSDSNEDFIDPLDMLTALLDDNLQLASYMRESYCKCETYGEVASVSLLENLIDETEQRVWYLFEASQTADAPKQLIDRVG